MVCRVVASNFLDSLTKWLLVRWLLTKWIKPILIFISTLSNSRFWLVNHQIAWVKILLIVDLFLYNVMTLWLSGAGAGFKVIWANENNKTVWETYKHNHPKTFLDTCSITDIKIVKYQNVMVLLVDRLVKVGH